MDGTTIRRNYKEAREIAAEFLCEKYNLKVSHRNDKELHLETSKGVFRLCLYIPDPHEVLFDLHENNRNKENLINGKSTGIQYGDCLLEKKTDWNYRKDGFPHYTSFVKKNKESLGNYEKSLSEFTTGNINYQFKLLVELMIDLCSDKLISGFSVVGSIVSLTN